MNKQDIQLLYKYNAWANKRILDTAALVTGEQFLAADSYPHGGLSGTLAHLLFAEWLWRKRCEGESPIVNKMPGNLSTLDSLRARWLEEEKALDAFIDGLTDRKLNAPFRYKTTRGDEKENILWQVLAHVVNHGTQHRGEAAAMLTGFNHSPGDIDLIKFLREMK